MICSVLKYILYAHCVGHSNLSGDIGDNTDSSQETFDLIGSRRKKLTGNFKLSITACIARSKGEPDIQLNLYNGHIGTSVNYGWRFPFMEVKQCTEVLVWDGNKCPEYRGFRGQTIH